MGSDTKGVKAIFAVFRLEEIDDSGLLVDFNVELT
jgi:hypothetical protein